ncbi:MAG: helix-turn-helix transcriptional regulator [Planctomycetota bacterium]
MQFFDTARRLQVDGLHYTIGANHHRIRRLSNAVKVWDRYAACLVLDGRGWYHDADGTRLPVRPGSLVHHFPDRHHHIEREAEGWEECSLILDRQLFSHFSGLGLIDQRRGVQACGMIATLVPRFQAIGAALDRVAAGGAARLLLECADLLLCIRESCCQAAHVGATSDPIEQGRRCLAGDMAAVVDLPGLATELGMSYATFRRRFRQRVGLAPDTYRTQQRLAQAAALLRFSRMPLQEVAERLGFSDAFSLSHAFKRHHGEAPSYYRARHVRE